MNARELWRRWRREISLAGVGLAALAGLTLLTARVSVFRVHQDTVDDRVVWVAAGQPVRQTVATHYPGLASVTVLLGEPAPPDDQIITLHVLELTAPPTERLALSGPLSDFRQGNRLVFQFDPLDEAAGRPHALQLSTEGEHPLPLLAHSGDMYTGGALATGGDLWLELSYRGRLLASLPVLLARLAAGKPGLFGQPWFYAALALASGAAWLGVMALAARQAWAWSAPPVPDGPVPH